MITLLQCRSCMGTVPSGNINLLLMDLLLKSAVKYLLYRLQSNPCSTAWSTSSTPFLLTMGFFLTFIFLSFCTTMQNSVLLKIYFPRGSSILAKGFSCTFWWVSRSCLEQAKTGFVWHGAALASPHWCHPTAPSIPKPIQYKPSTIARMLYSWDSENNGASDHWSQWAL